ncbi:porin family protein [bacterium]|nr:porin family protein [bacterium]
MKRLPFFMSVCAAAAMMAGPAAGYSNRDFRSEIKTGLDIAVVTANPSFEEEAPGELGADVYFTKDAVVDKNVRLFIPASMYVRAGGGVTLGFATSSAKFGGARHDADSGWSSQIGLGWNLSSFVRTEIDFQTMSLKFTDLHDYVASYQTVGGMLYFDLARRYIATGDVMRRRTLVPFIGVGASVGHYEFEGPGGADGVVFAAPRAVAGFNVMLTDLIGVDVMYQYQLMSGNGYGWGTSKNGANGISNIMASFRVNF